MTDTHLQYYKGLQADIKATKDRIDFIESCLKKMDSLKWYFQIQSPNQQFKYVPYELRKGIVRGILLNDLMVYRDHLKSLEAQYADNRILEVKE